MWCALPCAIFVPPLKREWKLAGISGTVFPFLFCFVFFLLGCFWFGKRRGRDLKVRGIRRLICLNFRFGLQDLAEESDIWLCLVAEKTGEG